MDEAGFRRFLKQQGKKKHVVDELVRPVRGFEEHLTRGQGTALEAAGAEALQEFVEAGESAEAGSARTRLRGLALYFQFAGNRELALLASEMREHRIAATRKPFPLRGFRGVEPEDLACLEAIGISNADQMLAAGRTAADREDLVRRTGIDGRALLEYVKLCDLSRIPGLKQVRARLYYDGGFDTLEGIAAADPEAMRASLAAFVERTGFEGIAPLPKEAQSTVAVARSLPRLVEY